MSEKFRLDKHGYMYPAKAYAFGNNIVLRDGQNKEIVRFSVATITYNSRKMLHELVNEIAEALNQRKPEDAKVFVPTTKERVTHEVPVPQVESRSTSEGKAIVKTLEDVQGEESQVLEALQKRRGRPRKNA